ncbi:unnamed protein product, partial [Didymodactylos carnosus]
DISNYVQPLLRSNFTTSVNDRIQSYTTAVNYCLRTVIGTTRYTTTAYSNISDACIIYKRGTDSYVYTEGRGTERGTEK